VRGNREIGIMNVRRFFAPSTREALRALKAELGADAIVLSNRAVAGGVEIIALPPGAIEETRTQRATESSPRKPLEASRETAQSAGASGNRGKQSRYGCLAARPENVKWKSSP
jgi:flagellar biosynthesis protein FlhF